jgi:hypothetical protein
MNISSSAKPIKNIRAKLKSALTTEGKNNNTNENKNSEFETELKNSAIGGEFKKNLDNYMNGKYDQTQLKIGIEKIKGMLNYIKKILSF